MLSVSPDEQPHLSRDEERIEAHSGPAARWRQGLVAFGRFWLDFLVGDTPELLVGSLLAIGAAALLVHGVGVRAVVVVALPVLVLVTLVLSSLRARARARPPARSHDAE